MPACFKRASKRPHYQNIQVIAIENNIREIESIEKEIRWRKLKGKVRVRFQDGTTALAEVHWYEAHGIGRKDIKIKRLMDL